MNPGQSQTALDYSRGATRGAWLSALLVLGLGALLWSAIFYIEWRQMRREVTDEFVLLAEERISGVEREIAAAIYRVEALAAFFNASDAVSFREFSDFTRPILREQGSLRALSWLPRVAAGQRQPFEAAARQSVHPFYRIVEREESGAMAAAAPREEYFPILYTQPFEANLPMLGLDHGSEPVRRATLEAARDSGKLCASARIFLPRDGRPEHAIQIVAPIYALGAPSLTVEERRNNLTGFVVGVFHVVELVERAYANLRPAGLEAALFDAAAPDANSLLYFRPSELAAPGDAPVSFDQYSPALKHERAIHVADRQWNAVIGATDSYIGYKEPFTVWQVFILGMLVTGLVAIYVFHSQRSASSIRHYARDLEESIARRESAERDRDRLLEELKQDKADLASLSEVTANAISTLELEELLPVLLERVARVMQADSAVIWIRKGGTLHIEATHGLAREELNRDITVTIGSGFIGQVAESRQPMALDNAQHEAHLLTPALRRRTIHSILGAPLRREGNLVGVIHVNWDRPRIVTEREQHLLEITGERCAAAIRNAQLYAHSQQLQQRLQTHIERMPIGCIVLDADFRVRLWNPAAEEIFRFSATEAMERPLLTMVMPEEERLRFGQACEELEQGQELVKLVMENRTAAGQAIICEWTVAVLERAAGSRISLLAMVQDISERQLLETQLNHAQKMEAVGQLAGGIAHDFNNILQVILAYSFRLSEHFPEDSTERADLREISNAGERAVGLTRQLLAFSRRQVMHRSDISINDLIEKLILMLRPVIGEHILLEFIPGAHIGTINADPGQIEQVLLNLCANARDAMPQGGRLVIETENVTVDTEYAQTHPWAREGRYVLLSVADTGIGMEPDIIDRIFDPFFTTKEEGQGTGLGLAGAYGIIKQHEGMIQVYSEPGHGTTFKVYLPIVDRLARTVGKKIEGRVVGGSETILLAENETSIRQLIEHILRRAGYTVLSAADGEEAVALFLARPAEINLVISDVIMPHKTGHAVFEEVRAVKPDIPFIFTSGYNANGLSREIEGARRCAFVQKPFDVSSLLRVMRQLLDEHDGQPGLLVL